MTMQETSYTGAQLAALTAGAHECRAPAPNIPDDLQRLQARLADLTSSAPRWERLVRAAAGAAVLDDVGWPGLAVGLDRAAAAGWDITANLPALSRNRNCRTGTRPGSFTTDWSTPAPPRRLHAPPASRTSTAPQPR